MAVPKTRFPAKRESGFLIYNRRMSAALGLYRLQQIDSQMDVARARLESIRQTIENDVELRAATERVSAAESHRHETERAQKQAEAAAQAQRTKIEQAESSLYGGAVRNPKELQDLQHDVASLKKYLATLEDSLLDTMQIAESSASSLTVERVALTDIESRLGEQTRHLVRERGELTQALGKLSAEREAASAPIQSTQIEMYTDLRHTRRGLAVAALSDGDCGGCGSSLTPGLQQAARNNNQIQHCPSCGRILFSG